MTSNQHILDNKLKVRHQYGKSENSVLKLVIIIMVGKFKIIE